ncbi:probable E3 ubiquitin-protein ligase BAH1-like 1 [Amborella trichopoda]|uniref:RING-type E3 ubiquitin transferase n=1 Tax=Amborella trichopoda TaxID=13333 RepID=W1P2V4_AMBTC|nr:probable E3 ubiquitin-protein ligase BAH1-like 1 [Amborella trichopoda]ERN02238.1 hypothetical protein AMTR_s00045p00224630 [Amborella trichopoda]|eukprot:XP_006840563.1 probable E3 ubiquitin-protein ligase BAH1-like 1 [Amborella trichopoda]
MKFCKKYQEYMEGQEKQLPRVGFKKLKKVLKKCRKKEMLKDGFEHSTSACPDSCSVCDATFFPSLIEEMSAIVCCFNARAKKLLELHLTSGVQKYIIWFRSKLQGNHVALVQEGKELVTYATINAVAIRKILKKYDKIHYSKQGQAFQSQAQAMHIAILQSPWLNELIAFHINLGDTYNRETGIPRSVFDNCLLQVDGDKPSLSCVLFYSIKIEIDLTCSICLETVFDPVSLKCGHIFCYMCACSAASVNVVDGLKTARKKSRCPLCRQV